MLANLLPIIAFTSVQQNYYIARNISFDEFSVSAVLEYKGIFNSSVIPLLNLTIISETYNHARIRITDLNATRWEVPDIIIPVESPIAYSQANYTVRIQENPFGLQVVRKSNNQTIFNIDPNQLFQYQNQDIIMTTSLPYQFFTYGIGERVTNFPLNYGTYTLFAKGLPGPYDDGQPPGKQMYSSQPIFIGLDSQGAAHGGFLLNSNAMDVTVTNYSITFRPIGGIIDYFVFVGPKPEDVVKQYHRLVGFPVLIPYWSLGYHQSRWGYHTLSDLQIIVENFTLYNLPLDVLWTDIDYMINFEDFTLDPTRYNYTEFGEFIDTLHNNNKKFVPICDAALPVYNYTPYNLALERNVLIGSPNHPGALLGSVWPGNAVYIDWFNPNATGYWHEMMSSLREVMKFDGFWVDMNDPSNFCNGECGYPASPLVQNLPYMPGGISLNNFTVDLAATHYGGLLEFDVHNLYALKMALASSQYFTHKLNTRPFIISRGSFPSHGRFASKWLGDNFSLWDWMGYSIPGIFNFQIFGIPLIGADLCGFMLDTNEELCCRWYQLGMLYPFSRNHNSNDTIPQEPWVFGPTLLNVSNLAIRTKYSLINYYYSHMFLISMEGGTLFKPTFFEFPNDFRLHSIHSQDQFMVGPALIIHPVLTENATTVNAYFPAEIWYYWHSGKRITAPFNRTVTLNAPLNGHINMHIRGGHIIPKNDGANTAGTLHDLRFANTTLVIAISAQGLARGFMVFDDGVSLGTIENKNYTMIEYTYKENDTSASLQFNVLNKGYIKNQGEWPFVSSLVLYGCLQPIRSVTSNGVKVDYDSTYDSRLQVATIKLIGIEPDMSYSLVFNF